MADALRALRPHQRWANVRVTGGPDGILVERRHGVNGGDEELWLDDLWLAERLADAARVASPAVATVA